MKTPVSNKQKVGVLQSLFGTPPSLGKKKNKRGKKKGVGQGGEEGEVGGGDSPPQSVGRSDYPQLNFPVSNTFMLGSPIAVFLLIRNQEQPLESDYSLPGCSR